MKNQALSQPFRGICLNVPKQEDFPLFKRMINEVLPRHDCNTLILLIRYQFEFPSHPEVVDHPALTRLQARELVEICRSNGIRLIPKMNLMGHQSEKNRGTEQGLLRAYPELDETPEKEPVSYCRSFCPRHPKARTIIQELVDDMIDAFEADAFHVGLDEIFEIGSCPRCRHEENHILFAEWLAWLHAHITGCRKAEMFMWGDRLLESFSMPYGDYESSANNTWKAIDTLPRDVIICDWHYNMHLSYPSIDCFIDRGFRVIGCPWVDRKSAQVFLDYAHRVNNGKAGAGKFIGTLQTSWCDSGSLARHMLEMDVPPPTDNFQVEIPRYVTANFPYVMKRAGS